MRIAFIAPFYPYPPSIGGVETIVRDTSHALAHRGHEVFIMTTPYDVTTFKRVTGYGIEEKDRVNVYKLKPSFVRVGYARVMKNLKGVLRESQPDVVHSHNLHPHLFQICKWRSELGYKVVAQLHHPTATGIDHLSARLVYPVVMWYLRRLQSKVDAFIAHTNLEKEWLVSKGIEERKVLRATYPCIPSNLLKYDKKSTSRPKHVLLFIGRITWRKGIHVLLRALPQVVHQVKNVEVVIAGPKDRKYYEMLLKLACELNLNDFIAFKRRLSEQEKYEQMSSCTVFVLPSIKEYAPVVLLEAQALGKPVISTCSGAIHEMVINGKTGLLVEPDNPNQLAEAIITLLQDEGLRRKMSLYAKRRSEDFVLEKAVDKLEEIYGEL